MVGTMFSLDTVESILSAFEQELAAYNQTATLPCDAAGIVDQMRTYYREAYDLWQLMEDLAPADFKASELLALRMLKLGVNPYTKACWQAKYAANWIKLGLTKTDAPAVAVIFFFLIEQNGLTPYSADGICRQIVYGLKENESLRTAIYIYVNRCWHGQLLPLADRIIETHQPAADDVSYFVSRYL